MTEFLDKHFADLIIASIFYLLLSLSYSAVMKLKRMKLISDAMESNYCRKALDEIFDDYIKKRLKVEEDVEKKNAE